MDRGHWGWRGTRRRSRGARPRERRPRRRMAREGLAQGFRGRCQGSGSQLVAPVARHTRVPKLECERGQFFPQQLLVPTAAGPPFLVRGACASHSSTRRWSAAGRLAPPAPATPDFPVPAETRGRAHTRAPRGPSRSSAPRAHVHHQATLSGLLRRNQLWRRRLHGPHHAMRPCPLLRLRPIPRGPARQPIRRRLSGLPPPDSHYEAQCARAGARAWAASLGEGHALPRPHAHAHPRPRLSPACRPW